MIAKKDRAALPSLTKYKLKKYETFRINMNILRSMKGKSAEQIGKELGFKKHYRYYSLENGRACEPKLEEVIKIAEYFKVSIDDLLFRKVKLTFE